jgi:hypothetical protein
LLDGLDGPPFLIVHVRGKAGYSIRNLDTDVLREHCDCVTLSYPDTCCRIKSRRRTGKNTKLNLIVVVVSLYCYCMV